MDLPTSTKLRIGEWCVNPARGEISRDGEAARVEARTMRLLLCLAEHAGEVVSIDELLNQVWADVTVSPDSVYQAVTSLRRLLGDDPKQPTYIATVPRLGYRMVATVGPWTDQPTGVPATSTPLSSARWIAAVVIGVLLVVLLALQFRSKVAKGNSSGSTVIAAQSQKSIAVLPFLDLTEGMKEEEFADG